MASSPCITSAACALPALWRVRVEPVAPATPEDAIVPLHQRIESGPGLGAERRDGVRRLANHAAPYPAAAARRRSTELALQSLGMTGRCKLEGAFEEEPVFPEWLGYLGALIR